VTKPKSKYGEIFSRSTTDARMFSIVPPLPVTRDVPLPERLAAFKAMKRKIRELGRR
jgi:hypothetical protein